MKTFFSSVLAFSLFTTFLNAQELQRCSTMESLELRQQQDPGLETRMQRVEERIQHYLEHNDLRSGGTIVIPIVFHIVHNGEAVGTGPNLSEAQVLSQLDVLNEDFRRLNADTLNTPEEFLPFADDTNIEFCLAVTDPFGNPTNGIHRYDGGAASWSSIGNIDGSLKPATVWNSEYYLNFWSVNFGSSGLLGYAQFPGDDPTTDGVVIGYQYVGRFPDNPFPGDYNLGRTATHEVGHWLNLRHIWGDGGCGADDGVSDTPASDGSNYGCPEGIVNCGTIDMVQNYMDYSDDVCMNIFTRGQGERMNAAILGARSELVNSFGCQVLEVFAYSGQVVDAETGLGVPNAQVYFKGNTFQLEAESDINGNFNIPGFLADDYTLYAGKWGYITKEETGLSIEEGSAPLVIEIEEGYYDDFILDFNWSVSGSVSTGDWQRAKPIAASFDGVLSNPGVDVTGDLGDQAYVTGNGGGDAGANDIDDGSTILTSPIFDLSDYEDPYISYYHWFYNGGGLAGSIAPNDEITISIDNGIETTVLDQTDVSGVLSNWNFSKHRIMDFVELTEEMTLIVETGDLLDGHIVEAGFDFFKVEDSVSIQSSVNSVDQAYVLDLFPNPGNGYFEWQCSFDNQGEPFVISVYNELGQLIYEESGITNSFVNGQIDLTNSPSGLYLFNIQQGASHRSLKLLIQ